MKKIFKGLINLILRHKILTFLMTCAIVILGILVYVFFNLFMGDSNKYGTRLNGIEKVKITETFKKDVTSKLNELGEVDSSSITIKGKVIYIDIVTTRETSLDRAKEIANSSLENFSDEEKKFYDIEFSLTQVKVEDPNNLGYVITGSKNASLDKITWIKS